MKKEKGRRAVGSPCDSIYGQEFEPVVMTPVVVAPVSVEP